MGGVFAGLLVAFALSGGGMAEPGQPAPPATSVTAAEAAEAVKSWPKAASVRTDGLRAEEKAVRERTRDALLYERTAMVSALVRIIDQYAQGNHAQEIALDRTAQRNRSKIAIATEAGRVLGAYRAPEAVPALVRHLTFVGRPARVSQARMEDYYPFTEALGQMGVPAAEAVTAQAEGTDDEVTAALAGIVLHKALGYRLGKIHLQDRIAAAEDPARKKRLTQVVGYMDEMETQPSKLMSVLLTPIYGAPAK